ncbi:MAG: holo-ACP synthase [Planctomycetes bacterium]|nr:holo-ACP synthase [Planctomycetota bacterium]
MHVVAHGIDIVVCERIEQMWQRHAERFLKRVYTAAEQEYCLAYKRPLERLSGRFAAKEAVFKALGTGWRGGVEWTDVETLPDPLGKPLVTLHGHAARLADTLGIEQVLLSISHAADYAIASALGLASSP